MMSSLLYGGLCNRSPCRVSSAAEEAREWADDHQIYHPTPIVSAGILNANARDSDAAMCLRLLINLKRKCRLSKQVFKLVMQVVVILVPHAFFASIY